MHLKMNEIGYLLHMKFEVLHALWLLLIWDFIMITVNHMFRIQESARVFLKAFVLF